MYKSDYFAYPIDEVEITSTSSNYDNERIEDIVVSIQGKDLLSLDLSDIKSKIRSDGWIRDVEIKKSRLKILKRYKNFIFFNLDLRNQKKLFSRLAAYWKEYQVVFGNDFGVQVERDLGFWPYSTEKS